MKPLKGFLRIALLVLFFLLAACQPTSPVAIVVTATLSPVTATPVVMVVTATPTATVDITPTPTQEVILGNIASGECIVLNSVTTCDILNNGVLLGQPTAINVTDGEGKRGRNVEVPPGWEYVFSDLVPGIPRATRKAGEQYSPSPTGYCIDGDCRYAIEDIYGVFGLSTGRTVGVDLEVGQGYLVKVEYDLYCPAEFGQKVDTNAVNVGVKILTSNGKTFDTEKKNPQSVSGFSQNIWLVKTNTPNASAVLQLLFTLPYAVCKKGAYLSLREIHLYPLPPSYGNPSDFTTF